MKNKIDFIRQFPQIVTNIDLDGFLSFFFLKKAFPEVLLRGLTNSHDKIYLSEDIKRKFTCYVDLWVNNPLIPNIDQHIVSYNSVDDKEKRCNSLKLNPNLLVEEERSLCKNYNLKYPFGTCHYILAELNRIGIEIDIDLNFVICNDIRLGDLIARADGCFINKLNYTYNVSQWEKWVKDYSKNGKNILEFFNYLNHYDDISLKKKNTTVEQFLIKTFKSKQDGGFNEINEINKENVKFLFYKLSEWTGCVFLKNEIPQFFNEFKGVYSLSTIDNVFNNSNNYFSYAFIKGKNSENNFSFTNTPDKTNFKRINLF